MTRMRSRLVTASLAVLPLLVHVPRLAFATRFEAEPTPPAAAPSPGRSGDAQATADAAASPSPEEPRQIPGLATAAAADPGSAAAPPAARPQPPEPAPQASTDPAALPSREGFHLGPADGEALARAYRR